MLRIRRTRSRALVMGVEALEARQVPAALLVSNVLDAGPGSLRQAILDAKVDADTNFNASTIDFAIPGEGVHTIALLTPLPSINASLTIDATTQPGYEGTPVVALDGAQAGAGNGLSFSPDILYSSITIDGLAIERFRGDGIRIELGGVRIRRSFIGLDPMGAGGGGNLGSGIRVVRATGGPVGVLLIDANVIAGNGGDGITLNSTGNVQVTNNLIGTDAAGRADIGNAGNGVTIGSDIIDITVSSNVISNNGLLAIDNRKVYWGDPAPFGPNLTTNNGTRLPDLVFTAATAAVTGSSGDRRALTYTVTNRGPGPATNVRFQFFSRHYSSQPVIDDFSDPMESFFFHHTQPVVDNFADPAVFQHVGTTTTLGRINPDAFVSVNTSFSLVMIDALDPRASATITVEFYLTNPGADTFDAAIFADQPSLSMQNSTVTTLAVTGTVDLAVSALPVPAFAGVGFPVALTFLVTNRDATFQALPDLTLTLPGPDVATVVSVTASRGTLAPVAGRPGVYAGRVIARRPNPTTFQDVVGLDPGESVAVTVVLVPLRAGPILSTLTASAVGNDDPDPASNLAFGVTVAGDTPSIAVAPTLTSTTLGPVRGGSVRSVTLGFSLALDRSRAEDVRNYLVTTGGRPLDIRSATYDAATGQVTLRLARPLAVRGTPVRVRLVDGRSVGLVAADGSTRLDGPAVTVVRRSRGRVGAS